MNEKQCKIWKYLLENAKGKDNAVLIKNIAHAMNVPDCGTNNDNVRAWIKEMVVKHKKPIGTCSQGVFIILNQEELDLAVGFVDRNSRTKAIRRNGIYKNSEEI